MRRIEGGVAAIISAIVDGLTFYNLDSAKRSVKLAIFHFSTMSLICLLLITAMSSSLFLTAPPISTIYGQQSLTAEIIPNATTGEVPATFEFEAAIAGGAGLYTISWDFGDGSEGSDERIVFHTFEQAGTYNVSLNVTDTSNQTAFDSMEITVEEALPIASVEITSNGTEGIAPATFEFETSVVGGTGPYTYLWNFGDGSSSEEIDDDTVLHTFEQAGTYTATLTVTDSAGQTGTDTQQVNVEEPPANGTTIAERLTVSFTVDSTNGDTAPATFLFEADAQDGTPPYTSHSWDFGDGSQQQGDGQSINHTFEQAGNYTVSLTVTDSAGEIASEDITITVQPPNGWIILLVVLASIVIGGTALGKYKMNQRSRRRIKIPPSAIVEIRAKGGIDQ